MLVKCAFTGLKAKKRLSCVNSSISSKSREVILPYSALVWLYLEYQAQFGAFWYKKDVDKPEQVQPEAIEAVSGGSILCTRSA